MGTGKQRGIIKLAFLCSSKKEKRKSSAVVGVPTDHLKEFDFSKK
jgi:hypothetical protein